MENGQSGGGSRFCYLLIQTREHALVLAGRTGQALAGGIIGNGPGKNKKGKRV